MTISYTADEHSMFSIAFGTWQGTVKKEVLTSSTFYGFMGLHVILISYRAQFPDHFPKVEWKGIAAVTSLTTFFIVFYSQQCYNRFMTFFGHCIGLGGVCMNWCALYAAAAACLPPCARTLPRCRAGTRPRRILAAPRPRGPALTLPHCSHTAARRTHTCLSTTTPPYFTGPLSCGTTWAKTRRCGGTGCG